jgi:DNA polymerase-1
VLARRRQLLTPGDEFRWSRFASSLNTPVQGGAADGIKRAIILIAQRLPPGSGLISTVHDELIALAPTETAAQVKMIVESCMIEAMDSLFPAVPVEVECGVCQNWSEK